MQRKGKKQLAEDYARLAERLKDYLLTLQHPNGFANLSVEGRRSVLAFLMASIVPADGYIRDEETERLRFHLHQRFGLEADTALHLPTLARQSAMENQPLQIAARLKDMLAIEDRCKIVLALWDLAMCDHELHQLEETLIYRIADAAAVPRRLVVEQQRRAAATSTIVARRA